MDPESCGLCPGNLGLRRSTFSAPISGIHDGDNGVREGGFRVSAFPEMTGNLIKFKWKVTIPPGILLSAAKKALFSRILQKKLDIFFRDVITKHA
jgi:hypothetical protein